MSAEEALLAALWLGSSPGIWLYTLTAPYSPTGGHYRWFTVPSCARRRLQSRLGPFAATQCRCFSLLLWQLKVAGTICREAAGSCDLPEYCTGASPYCPANVYLLDGSSCAYGEAYCNNGMCMTHHQQCVQLWGPGESHQPSCHPCPEQEPRWVSALCLPVGSPWSLPVGLEGSGWRGCVVPIQGWWSVSVGLAWRAEGAVHAHSQVRGPLLCPSTRCLWLPRCIQPIYYIDPPCCIWPPRCT